MKRASVPFSFAVYISVVKFYNSMKRLEHFIPGTKTRGNLVGVYNPGGNEGEEGAMVT